MKWRRPRIPRNSSSKVQPRELNRKWLTGGRREGKRRSRDQSRKRKTREGSSHKVDRAKMMRTRRTSMIARRRVERRMMKKGMRQKDRMIAHREG